MFRYDIYTLAILASTNSWSDDNTITTVSDDGNTVNTDCNDRLIVRTYGAVSELVIATTLYKYCVPNRTYIHSCLYSYMLATPIKSDLACIFPTFT